MNIPQLPADKAGHLIAGLVVFCIFGLFSPIIGLCAAVVVGAAKEASDGYINYRATGSVFTGPHGFEFLDFLATAGGGAIGYYCTFL